MLIGLVLVGMTMAAEWTPLWETEAPGAPKPAEGTEKVGDRAAYTDIGQPQYFLHSAEGKATGQGVVIFPGGGYTVAMMDHEGHEFGQWLAGRGITAMVVKYRVSGRDELGYHFPVPYLDARRAIRTMRAHAEEWGIDPGKIGVMGFSAGGHLASLCATKFDEAFDQETKDKIDQLSCRPDFAVLVYPVISMGDITHQGSRRRLAGPDPSKELLEALSTERQVSEKAPPCFLLTTSDDMVDCRNSLRFAEACKAHGVPVALHMFEQGGHGYGLHGNGNLAVWPELLEAWLKARR
ncbi:hypothetical protein Hsar01_01999 [Haloferula sargassicola]|uniref:BD-FAE-like domain-containing protein n=2 Tax=Haloferula sargassicola TaxID=490096 RepID=A0ABP9UMG2_9BACT